MNHSNVAVLYFFLTDSCAMMALQCLGMLFIFRKGLAAGEEEDNRQCFIAVEQQLTVEVTNIVGAIFYLLATHYVFNVQYHAKAKDLLLFLQGKVLKLPCPLTKSATTTTHTTGIARYLDSDEMEH